MLKKFIFLVWILLQANVLLPSGGASSGQSTESSYVMPLTQNIQAINQSTALLTGLLGKLPQNTQSASAYMEEEMKALENEITEAVTALRQERDELNNVNAYMSSIATNGSLQANIRRYDTQVLPNKIRELYEQ